MSTALLDIHDINLQLWHGEQLLQSPGYALLDGQQYRFGSLARSAARLRPRDINSRYWWQLNTEPLQPALGPARHTADLVHAHLQDMYERAGKPEELIVAVPASMQREQLALLLGIIEHCPFSAVGLVNRSVALASLYSGPGRLYHLEIQLHQAVISELCDRQGNIELERVSTLPGCGWLQLQDRLAGLIGSAFIRQTRFDPRHTAETEQQLYDHLPEMLLALQNTAEYHLKMAGYRIRVSHSDVLAATESLLSSASDTIGAQGPEDHIMLDSAAVILPGLFEQYAGAIRLGDNALFEAVEQQKSRLIQRDGQLSFINKLPVLALHEVPSPNAAAEGTAQHQGEVAGSDPLKPTAPTHLLKDCRATPLIASGTRVDAHCELHCLEGQWRLRGDMLDSVHVNGAAYSPDRALVCGDTISTVAGTDAVLIEVAD